MRSEIELLIRRLKSAQYPGGDVSRDLVVKQLQSILDAHPEVETRWDCIGPQTCTDCGMDYGEHQAECPRLARIEGARDE